MVILNIVGGKVKLIQLLWRTVWKFQKKLKLELPYDPAIPLLGIYPEKTINFKGYLHLNVYCSTVYNSQDMGSNSNVHQQRNGKDVAHIYNRILLSRKKE